MVHNESMTRGKDLTGELLKAVSRSFYLTIYWLPAAMRSGVALGYMLARATDSVADTSSAAPEQRESVLRAMGQAIAGDASDAEVYEMLQLSKMSDFADSHTEGLDYLFLYKEYPHPQFIERLLSLIPKKYHKRANKRNLLRRRTKESYRLQKEVLTLRVQDRNLDVALIYSAREVLPSKKISHAVHRILESIAEHL